MPTSDVVVSNKSFGFGIEYDWASIRSTYSSTTTKTVQPVYLMSNLINIIDTDLFPGYNWTLNSFTLDSSNFAFYSTATSANISLTNTHFGGRPSDSTAYVIELAVIGSSGSFALSASLAGVSGASFSKEGIPSDGCVKYRADLTTGTANDDPLVISLTNDPGGNIRITDFNLWKKNTVLINAYTHIMTNIPAGGIPSISSDGLSSVFLGRFYRYGTSADYDTYTGEIAIISVDIHYQTETFGTTNPLPVS